MVEGRTGEELLPRKIHQGVDNDPNCNFQLPYNNTQPSYPSVEQGGGVNKGARADARVR